MDNSLEIKLEKGQRLNLERADGSKITDFCVGANWGTLYETPGGFFIKKIEVDLDLNCIVIDDKNEICDYLNCAAYKTQKGKFKTNDGALHHSGDDTKGDEDGDDSFDNETITVNLSKLDSKVSQIFFFLNNLEKNDFSQIPFVEIRIYEGDPEQVENIFACYNVSTKEYSGKRALIMGKLYKNGANWEFHAIGDLTDDDNLLDTIERIKKSYLFTYI